MLSFLKGQTTSYCICWIYLFIYLFLLDALWGWGWLSICLQQRWYLILPHPPIHHFLDLIMLSPPVAVSSVRGMVHFLLHHSADLNCLPLANVMWVPKGENVSTKCKGERQKKDDLTLHLVLFWRSSFYISSPLMSTLSVETPGRALMGFYVSGY